MRPWQYQNKDYTKANEAYQGFVYEIENHNDVVLHLARVLPGAFILHYGFYHILYEVATGETNELPNTHR